MTQIINMIFAIILILIFFLVSFLDFKMINKEKKIILFLFIIIFVIFLGFRNIGLDIEPYRLIFTNQGIIQFSDLISNLFTSGLEPFFIIVISTLKQYGIGFNGFLLISAAIPMLIIFSIIKKKAGDFILISFLLFLLIHFFMGPVNIIRHFFAASIYLSAIYSLSKQSKFKFWMKSASSVFVHYSNISIFLVYKLIILKWSKNKYIIVLFFVTLFASLLRFIINNIELELANINTVFLWKLIYYLKVDYSYISTLHKVLYNIMNYFPLLFNIVFIFLAVNKVEVLEKNNFYRLLLNSQIAGSLIAIFFIILGSSSLGLRLNFLFSIGNFLLVKEVIFNYYSNVQKPLYIFTILSLVFYNLIIILYNAGVHNPMSPFSLV